MIPVARIPEPEGFDQDVRQPGLRWLSRNPHKDLPDYWNTRELRGKEHRYFNLLRIGFRNLCGYLAMLDMNGTVDHFMPKTSHRSDAYEWNNYRYCTFWFNSSKNAKDYRNMLDPFEIGEDWFEIVLPSLHLAICEDRIPAEFLAKARYMLENLPMRDQERVISIRSAYREDFLTGELSLKNIDRMAPLLGRAFRRRIEATIPREEGAWYQRFVDGYDTLTVLEDDRPDLVAQVRRALVS